MSPEAPAELKIDNIGQYMNTWYLLVPISFYNSATASQDLLRLKVVVNVLVGNGGIPIAAKNGASTTPGNTLANKLRSH
jgi:hypothetical protein